MSGITNANDITIGIESVAGSIGLEHSQNIYPPSLYSIVFSPPSSSTASPITDVAANWNDNEETQSKLQTSVSSKDVLLAGGLAFYKHNTEKYYRRGPLYKGNAIY